jgi:hypothetical protein
LSLLLSAISHGQPLPDWAIQQTLHVINTRDDQMRLDRRRASDLFLQRLDYQKDAAYTQYAQLNRDRQVIASSPIAAGPGRPTNPGTPLIDLVGLLEFIDPPEETSRAIYQNPKR